MLNILWYFYGFFRSAFFRNLKKYFSTFVFTFCWKKGCTIWCFWNVSSFFSMTYLHESEEVSLNLIVDMAALINRIFLHLKTNTHKWRGILFIFIFVELKFLEIECNACRILFISVLIIQDRFYIRMFVASQSLTLSFCFHHQNHCPSSLRIP